MGLDTGYEDVETDELMKILDSLYEELNPKLYPLISKIVNAEIELESRCNE